VSISAKFLSTAAYAEAATDWLTVSFTNAVTYLIA
jgi:hypothetical protein